MAPTQGGLTDLVGRPVVGPAGNPSDVLASWTVAAPTGPSDPNNLGVLWPGPVNVTWDAAVSWTTTLAAGQTSDERFVAIYSGFYGLQTQPTIGAVDVRIEDSQGTTVLEADDLTQLSDASVELNPGVYHVLITPVGSSTASVVCTLKPPPLDYEKMLDNGVGQSPSLGFSLVGPAPSSPGDASMARAPTGHPTSRRRGAQISTGAGTGARRSIRQCDGGRCDLHGHRDRPDRVQRIPHPGGVAGDAGDRPGRPAVA